MIGLRFRLGRKKPAHLHRKGDGRLDWKHWEVREAQSMIKGTNRRVVVVRSPDPKIFEEAIFIIREDLFHRGGSPEKIMAEARRSASDYLRKNAKDKGSRKVWARLRGTLFGLAGALAAGAAWLAYHFVGV